MKRDVYEEMVEPVQRGIDLQRCERLLATKPRPA